MFKYGMLIRKKNMCEARYMPFFGYMKNSTTQSSMKNMHIHSWIFRYVGLAINEMLWNASHDMSTISANEANNTNVCKLRRNNLFRVMFDGLLVEVVDIIDIKLKLSVDITSYFGPMFIVIDFTPTNNSC